MEAVGAASSILAIVEIGGKIGLLCAKYISEVRDAKQDAERIQKETQIFNTLLNEVEDLLNGPFAAKLRASQSLNEALRDSKNVLERLQSELEQGLLQPDNEKSKRPSFFKSVTKGFKSGSLKWPFKKKDVEKILGNLRALQSTITLALQIDNFSMVAVRDQRINLEKLPIVRAAIFGSLEDQHEPLCLPDTRTEVLKSIEEWTTRPKGQDTGIFWLRGIAGTGKSTIARSVASHLKGKDHLGASFFFKKSLAQRNSGSKVIPTFAYSLAQHVPNLAPYMNAAIDEDPDVFGKAYKEQFEKLIYQPFSRMETKHASTVVIVMDALDECEKEEDIILIISCLGRLKDLRSVDLRLFLTSRPEFGLVSGFQQLEKDGIRTHDLVLHEVAQDTVNRDISIFLKLRFAEIQSNHSSKLPGSWPGQDIIQQLVKLAEPLFISAATICRFVDDKHFSPAKRLDTILKSPHKAASSVYQIYLTVFSQIVAGLEEMDHEDKEIVLEETNIIVSTIVMLEAPIPRVSLSELIGMEDEVVHYRLKPLQSILRIPTDPDLPVQTFHLSFRDFLVDSQNKSEFSVNEKEVHGRIAEQCIELLSKFLKTNICGLVSPGTFASDINAITVQQYFSPELAYACQYWAHHFTKSKNGLEKGGIVDKFLREHLLHWLEATSILGISSNNITVINDLQSLASDDQKPDSVSQFLQDISRFIAYNQAVITEAPLQVYCSALLFSPEESIVKTIFSSKYRGWIKTAPSVAENWSALRQTLEGHSSWVNSVAFSPDKKRLASASSDSTIKIWDVVSGMLKQTLDCGGQEVSLLAFSPDGKYLASASDDTIRIWDAQSGILQYERSETTLSSISKLLVFSRDSELLVWGVDCTVYIYDPVGVKPVQILEDKEELGYFLVRCSSDCRRIATINSILAIKIWDSISGAVLKEFAPSRGDDAFFKFVVFSSDDKIVALMKKDGEIQTWDAKSLNLISRVKSNVNYLGGPSSNFGEKETSLPLIEKQESIGIFDSELSKLTVALKLVGTGHGRIDNAVVSPAGDLLADISGKRIRLWDLTSGRLLEVLEGHSHGIESLDFSPDGNYLASGSMDRTVRLWAVGSKLSQKRTHTYPKHQAHVNFIKVSGDERWLASDSTLDGMKIWDISSVVPQLLRTSSLSVRSSFISKAADGKLLGISSDNAYAALTVRDLETGALLQSLEEENTKVDTSPPFLKPGAWSYDDKRFAVSFDDCTIILWTLNPSRDQDPRLYIPTRKLEADKALVKTLTFSWDGLTLASAHEDRKIRVWDVESGKLIRMIETGSPIFIIAFSPNSKWLATCGFSEKCVKIWDAESGTLVKEMEASTHDIYFSKGGEFLETETGHLDIRDLSTCSSGAVEPQNMYYLQGGWLSRNGEKILWFPEQYRPNALSIRGDRLYFGCNSGYVGAIQFDSKGPPIPFTDG
ncbi:hypothetical protein TWF694_007268 [Orbilia ellipsospora]|uniref:NACHT domain-containing protein n=1 Tax=Orbilia ellipsospora TaxID=2528407 RepID=A0AAV9XNY6_9PEZI